MTQPPHQPRYPPGSLRHLLQAECSALRAMINCNVCHQRQKDVIITKCWHMFCQQCIKRNLGGQQGGWVASLAGLWHGHAGAWSGCLHLANRARGVCNAPNQPLLQQAARC